jgi:transcriptional regulator with XRE-family HTH domain
MATIGAVMPRVDGEKLAGLREERFFSHRELARLSGVSPQTVLNLEHGKGDQAQRRTVRKLAEALGVEPRELLADD